MDGKEGCRLVVSRWLALFLHHLHVPAQKALHGFLVGPVAGKKEFAVQVVNLVRHGACRKTIDSYITISAILILKLYPETSRALCGIEKANCAQASFPISL